MRCAHPEKHYLLLGNCPGCNPEGYASLFSGPLESEDEERSANVGAGDVEIPADL